MGLRPRLHAVATTWLEKGNFKTHASGYNGGRAAKTLRVTSTITAAVFLVPKLCFGSVPKWRQSLAGHAKLRGYGHVSRHPGRRLPDVAIAPGETIREMLQEASMSQAELLSSGQRLGLFVRPGAARPCLGRCVTTVRGTVPDHHGTCHGQPVEAMPARSAHFRAIHAWPPFYLTNSRGGQSGWSGDFTLSAPDWLPLASGSVKVWGMENGRAVPKTPQFHGFLSF